MLTTETEKAYISAEFQLENPGIFYQFKLRRHRDEPLFAIVGKGSKALESLNKGDLIPMTYHFRDRTIPAERKPTRIKYILDGTAMGFKDHFIIALDINKEDQ
ncbi:MAG: hypothetical protein MI863_09615 [Desulfobacterales bacterium]|nr:hypothetical protein [Desulfobacterales bacterium]